MGFASILRERGGDYLARGGFGQASLADDGGEHAAPRLISSESGDVDGTMMRFSRASTQARETERRMFSISHQTIRLSTGTHRSPDEGACVMELASMLAGEPFSDHPKSVCPVIGAFLRDYNDSVGEERRQDLYRCAASVVGTRASTGVQRARAAHLSAWNSEMRRNRYASFLPSLLARALSRLVRPPSGIDALAGDALRSVGVHTDQTHAAVLALVDELVAIGAREPAERDSKAPPSGTPKRPRAELQSAPGAGPRRLTPGPT